MNGKLSRFGYTSNSSGSGSGAVYLVMASHGLSTFHTSPFFIDFEGDFNAFNTPAGDQLDL